MRDFEELNNIICEMDDNLFDRLNKNALDAFMGDRNAQARFSQSIKQGGTDQRRVVSLGMGRIKKNQKRG